VANAANPGARQRLAPGSHPPNVIMFVVGLRRAWMATAIALAAPAYSFAGDCGSTPYDSAIYYIEHHHASEGVHVLHPYLAQSAQNLKVLNLLGIALTEAGQVESADARFKQALAIDPSFYPARKNLAVNQFNSRHRDDATRNFAQVLEQVPTDDIANTYLG